MVASLASRGLVLRQEVQTDILTFPGRSGVGPTTVESVLESPEGSVGGCPGDLRLQRGSVGRLWLKQSGDGNTGWSQVALTDSAISLPIDLEKSGTEELVTMRYISDASTLFRQRFAANETLSWDRFSGGSVAGTGIEYRVSGEMRLGESNASQLGIQAGTIDFNRLDGTFLLVRMRKTGAGSAALTWLSDGVARWDDNFTSAEQRTWSRRDAAGVLQGLPLVLQNTSPSLTLGESGGSAGFLGAAAIPRQSIAGSRGGNVALANLLTAMASFGFITDNTVP